MDIDYRMEQFIADCENTYFGGEAIAYYINNYGPSVVSAFIGSVFKLGEDTVWFDTDPLLKDWKAMPGLTIDPKRPMYKAVLDSTDYFGKMAKGRYLNSITDLGGVMDIAASLRGTQTLLMDLYDVPDQVESLIDAIDDLWLSAFDTLCEIIERHQKGMASWMPIWCRERYFPLQNDFSAMMSPGMFERFSKPSLKRKADYVKNSIYHWDGLGALEHLDHLLDIDSITGIQWTPGAGKPNVCDPVWFPYYKKIQDKGKNLVILQADPNKIELFVRTFSRIGVFIHAVCEDEQQARELIRKNEEWSLK